MILDTARTRLRCWREGDRPALAAMNADPEVMRDQGGPIDAARSGAKLDRYAAAFDATGFCRWAIETRRGEFLGYVGVMPSPVDHPLGPHFEIGWRLVRAAWGQGYATEGARAALDDVFTRVRLREVLSYTAADNPRSQAVMARLGLRRDSDLDFTAGDDGVASWSGQVWVARPD